MPPDGHREPQHPLQEAGDVAALVGPERQEERRDADGHRRHQGQVPGQERERQGKDRGGDDREQAHHVLRDEQVRDPFHVADHPPAFGDHRWQVGELAVQQHQLGDRLGGLRAVAHRDADVGVLERQRVVDAVAGHRHDVPVGTAARCTSARFCSGDTRPNTVVFPAISRSSSGSIADGAGVHRGADPSRPDPGGDRGDRGRVVAGDDLDRRRPGRRSTAGSRAASGRTCSVSVTSAVGCRPAGSVASSDARARPAQQQHPAAGRGQLGHPVAERDRRRPAARPGAPNTQVPRPSKVAADHLRAELNAMVSVASPARRRRDAPRPPPSGCRWRWGRRRARRAPARISFAVSLAQR